MVMRAVNGNRLANGRRSAKAMRELIASAFVQTLTWGKASRPAAARWMGVDAGTVKNWATGKSPIRVEAVLMSPKLGEHFLACLAVGIRKLERAERAAKARTRTLPHVLRDRRKRG